MTASRTQAICGSRCRFWVFSTQFFFVKDGFAFSQGASEKKYAIKIACQTFHTCAYAWSAQSVDVGAGKATVL
jgi:hypothetical protein